MLDENLTPPELEPVFGPARQIAFIVDDIDAAMQAWQDAHNAGPFVVARNAVPFTNARYRGAKAENATIHVAFAYLGDLQLELIKPVGVTPGIYQEAIDRKHQGVHHYAVCVEDFDAAYDHALASGYESVIDTGVKGLARMSYVENLELGRILEIIEWNTLTQPYFNGIEALVRSVPNNQNVQEFQLTDLVPKRHVAAAVLKFAAAKLFRRS